MTLDLRAPFERLVEDAAGEFGPTPLARLMAAHLPLFVDLHRRRVSGAQIADLLTEHGITGTNGPLTANVVRATYSRVCAAAANAAQRNEAQRVETQRNTAKRDGSDRRLDATEVKNARPAGPQRNGSQRCASQCSRRQRRRR